MKAPAFQFYADKWMANAKLRMCSAAARGTWIDCMCLMHNSDEYGVLRHPLADVANALGAKVALLRELSTKQVLKGGDRDVPAYVYTPRHANKDGAPVILLDESPDPMWYSSRMVRDQYIRSRSGGDTRFKSGDPPPSPPPRARRGEPQGDDQGGTPGATPSGTPGQRQGTGSSSTASTSLKAGVTDGSGGARANVTPIGEISPKTQTPNWWKSEPGIEAEARRWGVEATGYDNHQTLKQKVFAAIKKYERKLA